MAAQRPTARCSTEGLSRAEVIVLLFQAFRTMKWGVAHLHPMRVVAITPRSAFSYGEEVVVDLDHEGFTAVSKFQEWTFVSGRKRHQRNLDALMDAFAEARVSTTPEIMAAELKELDESGAMQQDAATAHANEFHWRDIGSMFIPRREFFATPMLIDASVLVFIAMVASGVHVLSPTGADLLEWGANHRPYTLDGQWWRLLTCCFVHIGVFHLLLNMYALLMIVLHLEPLLGRWHIVRALRHHGCVRQPGQSLVARQYGQCRCLGGHLRPVRGFPGPVVHRPVPQGCAPEPAPEHRHLRGVQPDLRPQGK